MLSPASLAIVRETLPAVGAAVPEITTVFYGKLFADHPDLLSDLFNRGNQANGTQQQALAGSIARFATMVVNNPGQDPGPLLARVAHKHASLGITPGQYEIVHSYLFAAIADVLGPAVTPEVAAASDDLSAYVCGPAPFIESIRQQLIDRGVPATRIQYELFGPDLAA
jgi:nitric oxide dioxygenase